jgi:hypothetical protein
VRLIILTVMLSVWSGTTVLFDLLMYDHIDWSWVFGGVSFGFSVWMYSMLMGEA